jgi:hypothetical protein
MDIDDVTKILLNYAKSDYNDFEWKSISKLLAPFYHYDMKIVDVLHVVTIAYENICREPKFQTEFDLQDLILCPTKMSVNLKSSVTVEEFYNKFIDYMMNRIKEAKIAWCLQQIGH